MTSQNKQKPSAKEAALRVYALVKFKLARNRNSAAYKQLDEELEPYRAVYRRAGAKVWRHRHRVGQMVF